MKHVYRNVFILIALAASWISLYGQEAVHEDEPPIPVYTVQTKTPVPHIQYDSLMAAHDSQFVFLTRQHKEMQISVAQSLSQIDAQFLLLYLFVALLAVTLTVMFIVYTRLKKEFAALRQTQKEISIPKDPLPSEAVLQPMPVPEQTEDDTIQRHRRVVSKKPIRKKKS
ncbi:MAG: hypothetical protein WAV76_07860 [Bacteroidota bacterium]